MSAVALVVDAESVGLLNATAEPDNAWYENFAVSDERIMSTIIDDVALVISRKANSEAKLLVINLGQPSLFTRFTEGQKNEVLRRILRSALSCFTTAVAIPHSWKPFNHGSRISFHALPLLASQKSQSAGRLELDRNPFGTNNAYLYNCSIGWSNVSLSVPDRALFDKAIAAAQTLISSDKSQASTAAVPTGAIQLSDESFFQSENTLGFVEWYRSRLTDRQRDFVDSPKGEPIRLRGAAGTGKTVALAIKLLMIAKDHVTTKKPARIIFLTHSSSTAAATEALLASLDNESVLQDLEAIDDSSITVTTLLELAMGSIGKDLEGDGIVPLATDALEGRQLQLELIGSDLKSYAHSSDWKLMRGLCSPDFRQMMESMSNDFDARRLAWELMNEYACVLDADGVRQKPEQRKRYIANPRQAWMMPLPSENDRKVVLASYDRFNKLISEMDAISVDQVVADFLNYLDSFRWNAAREKRGYDYIFVDELHLFNRQERMVFHGLTRSQSESPSLFMAYDAKQAPSDTFMPVDARETNSSFWGRLNVGGIQKVELDRVFRYTPEIAAFVQSLDQSFPALDLGEEWGEYNFSSAVKSAEVPTITTLFDDIQTYSLVFQRAHNLKRKGGEKFSVAILCCNADQFAIFRNAGQYKKYFSSISSREEAASTRPDAFRFVLSTPEYVAGLQFDCVLLVDVNRSEVPDVAYSSGIRRRFISTIYLGSSRARHHLELYAVSTEGGASQVLSAPVDKGALRSVLPGDLADPADIVRTHSRD